MELHQIAFHDVLDVLHPGSPVHEDFAVNVFEVFDYEIGNDVHEGRVGFVGVFTGSKDGLFYAGAVEVSEFAVAASDLVDGHLWKHSI